MGDEIEATGQPDDPLAEPQALTPSSTTAVVCRRILDAAAAQTRVDGVGCLMMDGDGALRFLCATDAASRVLELAEELCVEGPCHEAFFNGDTVVDDIHDDQRWGRLSTLLRGTPVRTVIGVQILLHGVPIGALDAISASPHTWTPEDFSVLRKAADQIGSLLTTVVDEGGADPLAMQVRAAVRNRELLVQATEMVAQSTGVSHGSAGLRLRQIAAATERSAADVAQRVVDAGRLPGPDELSDLLASNRREREEMTRLAFTDPLTGLPNRVLFLDRLGHALARARRTGHAPAVLFVDLDRFKVVNDSLGHDVGDEVLRRIARRLAASVRPEDTVSRLGGDEFALLCETPADAASASTLAQRLAEVVGQPLSVRSSETGREQWLSVKASVGISVPRGAAVRAVDVLRDADMAMYEAKAGGGNRASRFSERLRHRAQRRMRIEQSLRAVLEDYDRVITAGGFRDGLSLDYQPIVRVDSEAVVGVEALVRYREPTLGPVDASELVAIAEETGLIGSLGDALLERACEDAAQWRSEVDDLFLAVNVSSQQFADTDFPSSVHRALGRSGMPADHLCLELTESHLLEAAGSAPTALDELDRTGVRLAVDDFGTGYSSLAYLARLPVSQLKIDRSFVSGMGDHGSDQAVVESVVSLARTLGLTPIAEGVERTEHAAALQALGVELVQGYLYGRPHPAEEMSALLSVAAAGGPGPGGQPG